MKNIFAVFLVALVCISLALPAQALQALFIDGLPIPISDQVLRDGAYFVPVRPLAAALGYDSVWNERTRRVTLTGHQNEITLAESVYVLANGNVLVLDRAPVFMGGVFYVPLRAILELLGADVDYVADTDSVFAYTESGGAVKEARPSLSLHGILSRAGTETRLTMRNTGRFSVSLLALVVSSDRSRLGLVGWVEAESGDPVTNLAAGREYETRLVFPTWVTSQ
ncbi:MAG TPA: copper amine oxidase N-terminal domain-containing protein, partial [Bacillota bacterium]|nr:copper amine oxidase N-terminal domain-containing protein [Bacillota bacterium]